MNSPGTVQSRMASIAAVLLIVGLPACGPQSLAPQEPETTQPARQATQPRAPEREPAPRPAPEVVRVTVPAGTEVHVTLSGALGSETSQVGDTLIATTTAPVLGGDRVAFPAGSTIRGRVTEVVPGTKGLKVSEKGGSVFVAFDEVTTPGGTPTRISASLASIAKSGGKTAGIIGGSAAGGAILGKILGGSSKDAAVGAVIGGGIGTGIAAGTKGKELNIPAGTQLTITLDQPLTVAAG